MASSRLLRKISQEYEMAIDADLILRQARHIQRLELDTGRAQELAEETRALIENVFAASQAAAFEDNPDQFALLLSELRDKEP